MPDLGVPGLYGKLPARGDFISRRLDPEFIEGWDAWLQRVIAESRTALGERWLECFLSAPVWRFVVPAGMFSTAGWAGLVLPSVDRVGRYFPLTLAAPFAEDSIDAPATLGKLMPWLDSIETLGLEALAPDVDLDVLDQRLAERPIPDGAPVVSPLDDDTVPLEGAHAAFQAWPLAAGASDTSVHEMLQGGALGRRASAAVWMTRGGETFAHCIAVCGGPIPGAHFCALLDGRWAEHAWTVAPAPMPRKELTPSLYCDAQNPGVDLIHGQGKEGGEVPPLTASPRTTNET